MTSSDGGPAVSTLTRVAGTVVLALGGGALFLTVAGFLGRLWWVFDLVANFRPQMFLVTVVLVGAAALARQFQLTGALGVAAALNLITLWPFLTGIPLTPPGGEPTLEILSFNVGVSNPQRGDVMAFIAEEDPDLVILLESSFEWEAAASAAGLPMRMVSVVPPTFVSGITVMARPELGASLLGAEFTPVEGVGVRVGLDGRFVDVLAIHPPSPTSAGRADRRDLVLAEAGVWAAGRSLPTIVVGDFNATPWSHAYRSMRRETGFADSLEGRGLQPTWRAGAGPLMIPIDHALHTDDIGVASRRTGPSLGSAHRALIVEFGFVGERG